MTKFNVFLHGLSLGQGNFRPAMIFKDKSEREVLPVWLDPLEANLLLAEANTSHVRQTSTHRASLKIFDALKISLKSIYFDEVNNSAQYATLFITQNDKDVTVRVRAAEALSLVVKAGCSFFTNKEVVEKSRALTLEHLLHMEQGVGVKGGTASDRNSLH